MFKIICECDNNITSTKKYTIDAGTEYSCSKCGNVYYVYDEPILHETSECKDEVCPKCGGHLPFYGSCAECDYVPEEDYLA